VAKNERLLFVQFAEPLSLLDFSNVLDGEMVVTNKLKVVQIFLKRYCFGYRKGKITTIKKGQIFRSTLYSNRLEIY
jgi:hypothetical protein